LDGTTVRRPFTHSLRWIDNRWLNAPAITAWGTVLLVVATVGVPLLMRRLDRHERRVIGGGVKERRAMLRRVRYSWITGVLGPSLEHEARLTLGLERRPDVLQLGSHAIRRPGRTVTSFPDEASIIDVFDQVSGGLLILGAPGAGKTTLLLQLADRLLERAEADPAPPIPVVVNLASWAVQREPLASWLVEELAVSYYVPRRLVSAWVAQDALVLLLDGLDEVAERHRAACAEAINGYRRDHGLVPIAVCTRTQELENLNVRLSLDEAVELLPPTDAQIDSYLRRLEATGTPLADVRALLATDQNLRDLLHSPLMLHVIALAYHGQPAPALNEPGSIEQRRRQLWEAYITRMFQQRPFSASSAYTAQQGMDWLTWLARAMEDRDLTEFQLDRLTPGWVYGPPAQRRARIHVLLARAVEKLAEPAEELHWSWKRLQVGLMFGFLLGELAGIASAWTDQARTETRLAWLGATLALGVFFGLLFGLFAGLTTSVRDKRAFPNEGIRQSARNATIGGLIGAIPFGVIGLLAKSQEALVFAGFYGLSFGFGTGGWACVLHYLTRFKLVRAGVAPWRYGSFLEAMAERLLLRRSGSAYIFTHRMLRDHLADGVTRDAIPIGIAGGR
jgi:hypothetical protein